jgi:hypothetical protein
MMMRLRHGLLFLRFFSTNCLHLPKWHVPLWFGNSNQGKHYTYINMYKAVCTLYYMSTYLEYNKQENCFKKNSAWFGFTFWLDFFLLSTLPCNCKDEQDERSITKLFHYKISCLWETVINHITTKATKEYLSTVRISKLLIPMTFACLLTYYKHTKQPLWH